MSQESQDLSLVDEFIAEAKEHLSNIEDDFLQLEKQDEKTDLELVNRIFRAMHTVKGTSGFLGLKNIGALSHAMESILATIREEEKKPPQKTIDLLLEGMDKLWALLDDVIHSNEHDISDLLIRLGKALSEDVSESDKKHLSKTIALRDFNGNPVNFQIRKSLLQSIPSNYCHLYLLTFDLTKIERTVGKKPMELIRSLRQTGEIIDGLLEMPSCDLATGFSSDGTLIYRLLYSTVLDLDLIAEATELDPSAIISIDNNSLIQFGREKSGQHPQAAPMLQNMEANETQKSEESVQDTLNQKQKQCLPIEKNRPATTDIAAKNAETLRIRLEVLDELMMLAGELVLVRNQQLMNGDRTDPVSRTITQRLDIVTTNLQESIMRTRMQPMGSIFGKFTRIVRDLGKALGKRIDIELFGNDVELDKTILETLTDPLTHLIRNCCDHGIETPEDRQKSGKDETGHITLRAFHEGGQMNIEIFDDGRGINIDGIRKKTLEKRIKTEEELSRMGEKELLSLIFLPGFSTVEKVSDLSGRGVGMDVVKTAIEKLSGVIDIKTIRGEGTQIYLRLPLTLAIIPSLIVISGGIRYAIPQINLEELVCLYDEQIHEKIECAGSREVYRLRNILLPIVHLDEILRRQIAWTDADKSAMAQQHRIRREENHQNFQSAQAEGKSCGLSLTFAVLKAGNTRFGLVIDNVIGTEEIVVKPMHRLLKNLSIYSGATVLGDGRVSLILDALGIARHAGLEFDEQDSSQHESSSDSTSVQTRELLLFRSGEQGQFALDLSAVKRIERIETKALERIGDNEFVTVDGQSTAIIRLESVLRVAPCKQNDEMFLLLPKHAKRPCGILASQLINIDSFALTLDTLSMPGAGIAGSAIINDHMSLVLDMEDLLSHALAV